ncbi:UDP-N-acetylmuramate dehydrogenase [Eupransor demetentiae]|uniref:UDP-N-acetylenolpyruvoylglucosamine reductase n=1 Tax=Eupransor demetentiae TaxID=3109584 RepID=A0ABP0ERG6_9LACO|nr:UDP-N-acetylenolpyruvoylglucosamine reductase (MurB) [Lactobacillaceae bacterium LMG 33000]
MQVNGIEILEKQPIAPYAYTQAGGEADYLAIPKNLAELKELLAWAKDKQLDLHVFGRLSNLVVRDGGLRGLVLILSELKEVQKVDEQTIRAQAGADLIWVANQALKYELSGLEWGAGIPGTVGGAVFMNAGAYGGQTDMVVSAVEALTKDGQLRHFDRDELGFGYRQSVFQENGTVIVSADFTLQASNHQAIQELMDENNYRRASKQPLNYPSNGSVFKRPVGHFAGKLIMDADLQGHREGGVEVSRKHAGFMVNIDHGTGNDYEDLIHDVQKRVKELNDIDLETEVRIIGER